MHFEALPVLMVSSKHGDEPLVLSKHLDKFQTLVEQAHSIFYILQQYSTLTS